MADFSLSPTDLLILDKKDAARTSEKRADTAVAWFRHFSIFFISISVVGIRCYFYGILTGENPFVWTLFIFNLTYLFVALRFVLAITLPNNTAIDNKILRVGFIQKWITKPIANVQEIVATSTELQSVSHTNCTRKTR